MEYLGPKCNLKCSLELAFKILKYSQTNAIKDETITTNLKHYSIKLGTQWPVQATSQDEPQKNIAHQTKIVIQLYKHSKEIVRQPSTDLAKGRPNHTSIRNKSIE